MKNLNTLELDTFVAFVDNECSGNISDPKIKEKFIPINLIYKTPIDELISPFSDEYFQSQLNLYEEISGRQLDQWTGELHSVDIDELINHPNPQGIDNTSHVSENVRVLSTMLSLSCLGDHAKVLDMGAGHGLSSEIYAFCGCCVHAIDIDPKLSELSDRRAEIRSLRITRSLMNFDSLSVLQDNFYEGAFFFQSLHHALRPWDLIAELKEKLLDNGVIAFAGEPIQNNWYKHWGIRQDEESLYVARKFGWFESGWSQEFIRECFNRNDLKLVLLEGGHQGGLIGITSKDTDKLNKIIDKARQLGFAIVAENEPAIRNYYSQIGILLEDKKLRPTIRTVSGHNGGYLCYGPYISLVAGCYRASFLVTFHGIDSCPSLGSSASFVFDIVSGGGQVTHYKELLTIDSYNPVSIINAEFVLTTNVIQLEARLFISESNVILEASLPVFEIIPRLSKSNGSDPSL